MNRVSGFYQRSLEKVVPLGNLRVIYPDPAKRFVSPR